jgi:hypothetical protein
MAFPALAMSSTKDELLKHLDLPTETYALMAVSNNFPQNPLILPDCGPPFSLNLVAGTCLLIIAGLPERD